MHLGILLQWLLHQVCRDGPRTVEPDPGSSTDEGSQAKKEEETVHLAGLEPETYRSRGLCSTAVIQPLPKGCSLM